MLLINPITSLLSLLDSLLESYCRLLSKYSKLRPTKVYNNRTVLHPFPNH